MLRVRLQIDATIVLRAPKRTSLVLVRTTHAFLLFRVARVAIGAPFAIPRAMLIAHVDAHIGATKLVRLAEKRPAIVRLTLSLIVMRGIRCTPR